MTSQEQKVKILRYDELSSTNDELKKIAEKELMDDFMVVITRAQVAGKGQAGNSWESEVGKNLTFSVLLHPTSVPVIKQFLISKMVSLAIADVLSDYLSDVSIKWPNDIYIGDKKICGILIENSIMGSSLHQSILGIGINVNQIFFRSDAPNPTSMALECSHEFDLEVLLSDILQSIYNGYNNLMMGNFDSISEHYAKFLYRSEGFFRYKDANGQFEARLKEVQDYGFLVLIDREGVEREYAFKEVEFLI